MSIIKDRNFILKFYVKKILTIVQKEFKKEVQIYATSSSVGGGNDSQKYKSKRRAAPSCNEVQCCVQRNPNSILTRI